MVTAYTRENTREKTEGVTAHPNDHTGPSLSSFLSSSTLVCLLSLPFFSISLLLILLLFSSFVYSTLFFSSHRHTLSISLSSSLSPHLMLTKSSRSQASSPWNVVNGFSGVAPKIFLEVPLACTRCALSAQQR